LYPKGDTLITMGCIYYSMEETPEFPTSGTKAEQAKWMYKHEEDLQDAHAIAFVIGASPNYVQKVLNE